MLTQPRTGSLAARMAATTRILVVEDEHGIAEFLRAFFRASGYDMIHVDPLSVAEVIEAVDEHRPDCVLLDLFLRGFSGKDAYAEFRNHPAFARTPVIVVTAMVHEQKNFDLRPIDGFFAKPFRVAELETIVAERIELARAAALLEHDPWWGFASPDALHDRLNVDVPAAWEGGDPIAAGLVALRNRASLVRHTGEMAADFVLREVAHRLSSALPGGLVARHGDAELAVVLPGTGTADAEEALDAAIDACGHEVTLPGGTTVKIDVCAGLAVCPDHAATTDQLWVAADAALASALDDGTAIDIAR